MSIFNRNKETEETNEIQAAVEASKPTTEDNATTAQSPTNEAAPIVVDNSEAADPAEVVIAEPDQAKPAPLASRSQDYDEVKAGGLTFKRKKGGIFDYSQKRTLDIPEEAKDNSLYYRFINDDRGRLEKALSNGYAKIDNLLDPTTGQDIAVKHRVGTKEDGSALYAHLVATPKDWRNERKTQAEKARREKEIGLTQSMSDNQGNLKTGEFYVKNTTQIADNNKTKI